MKRPATIVLGVIAAAILSACGVAVTSPRPASHGSRDVPPICPTKGQYQPFDPRDALPLPGNAIAPAVNDAIREAEHEGNAELRRIRRGALAYNALIARPPGFTSSRGSVQFYCGKRIAKRTVIVDLFFPHALPSASLSISEVWVSRFPHNRYRVWFTFH